MCFYLRVSIYIHIHSYIPAYSMSINQPASIIFVRVPICVYIYTYLHISSYIPLYSMSKNQPAVSYIYVLLSASKYIHTYT